MEIFYSDEDSITTAPIDMAASKVNESTKRKLEITKRTLSYQFTENITQCNTVMTKTVKHKSKYRHRKNQDSSSESENSETENTEDKQDDESKRNQQ